MKLEKMEIGNRQGRILSTALSQIYHDFIEGYSVFANRADDFLDPDNKVSI